MDWVDYEDRRENIEKAKHVTSKGVKYLVWENEAGVWACEQKCDRWIQRLFPEEVMSGNKSYVMREAIRRAFF